MLVCGVVGKGSRSSYSFFFGYSLCKGMPRPRPEYGNALKELVEKHSHLMFEMLDYLGPIQYIKPNSFICSKDQG